MDACLAHTIKSIAAPVEIGLHSARMVNVVMCSVICLLEADYSIHSMLGEFCVIFCGERHDLDFQIREILLRDV